MYSEMYYQGDVDGDMHSSCWDKGCDLKEQFLWKSVTIYSLTLSTTIQQFNPVNNNKY